MNPPKHKTEYLQQKSRLGRVSTKTTGGVGFGGGGEGIILN